MTGPGRGGRRRRLRGGLPGLADSAGGALGEPGHDRPAGLRDSGGGAGVGRGGLLAQPGADAQRDVELGGKDQRELGGEGRGAPYAGAAHDPGEESGLPQGGEVVLDRALRQPGAPRQVGDPGAARAQLGEQLGDVEGHRAHAAQAGTPVPSRLVEAGPGHPVHALHPGVAVGRHPRPGGRQPLRALGHPDLRRRRAGGAVGRGRGPGTRHRRGGLDRRGDVHRLTPQSEGAMGDAALRKVIMLRRDWRGRQCDTPVDKFFSTHRERRAQNRRDTSKSPRVGSRVRAWV